jgi:hypothetical protein
MTRDPAADPAPQPRPVYRCVYCAIGHPERCSGFVGVPVDGPKGQHVYECAGPTVEAK